MKSKQYLASEHFWAKKLPTGWRYEFFTDLISDTIDNRGRTVPTSDSGIPLIATNCISNDSLYPKFKDIRYVSQKIHDEWFRDGHVESDDIIFVNKGSPGQVCLVPSPINFCFAQDMIGLKINNKKIDFRYLLAVLRTKFMQEQIFAFHVGTLIPHLKKADLKSIIVPIPPKKLEEYVGKYYLTLSKKIENLQTQNKILEQTAQAIFKSWFVDFDVHTEFEDSELGQIPKGWKIESLDDNINFLNGLALQNFRPLNEEFLPAIKIKEMNEGISEKTEKVGLHIDPKYIINNGDVLFSWSGSLVLTLWCFGRGALNQHLFKVTSEKYTKWFFYQWTKFHLPEFRLIAAGKVTTMGHIQRHHLHEALILVPPIKILENYNTIFQPIFDQIISNKLEVENLTKTRDALLPKLMSGEIRV